MKRISLPRAKAFAQTWNYLTAGSTATSSIHTYIPMYLTICCPEMDFAAARQSACHGYMHICIHSYTYTYTYIYIYTYTYIYLAGKTRQNGRKMTSFRGATAARPSWELAWTGWIGSAPVQISRCGLDGALSWCGQGEEQSFLVSSWASRAVAVAPSFQTCFACVHMYMYACVYICVCVYVCGHDICIDVHLCMDLYIYAFIHVCMCMCMHICA